MGGQHSFLFVPADRPDRLGKALAGRADAVSVDLEDGVAPESKAGARDAVLQFFETHPPQRNDGKLLVLRTNDTAGVYFADDLALALQLPVHALMIPKCESPEDVASAKNWNGEIIPLIESARGLHQAERILLSDQRVRRAAFGAVDFALDLGVQWSPGGMERAYPMGHIATLSRALGCQPPIDAVFPEFNDQTAFTEDALRGKQLGFGGKMAIHPRQIEWLEQIYRPLTAQIEWAKRVIQAARKSTSQGAFQLDGKLIDRPIIQLAERVLASNKNKSEGVAAPQENGP